MTVTWTERVSSRVLEHRVRKYQERERKRMVVNVTTFPCPTSLSSLLFFLHIFLPFLLSLNSLCSRARKRETEEDSFSLVDRLIEEKHFSSSLSLLPLNLFSLFPPYFSKRIRREKKAKQIEKGDKNEGNGNGQEEYIFPILLPLLLSFFPSPSCVGEKLK